MVLAWMRNCGRCGVVAQKGGKSCSSRLEIRGRGVEEPGLVSRAVGKVVGVDFAVSGVIFAFVRPVVENIDLVSSCAASRWPWPGIC